MNFHRPIFFARSARWWCAGMVALFFAGMAHAQPAEPGRWLLVFDTSVTMKKRLPATAEALKHFLASGADDQLQPGDSVAVWTYGRHLSAGQFAPVDWQPERAALLGSNLVSFLRLQRYTNSSSFAPVQASLNRVIANSERLTIVIFCDGLSTMNFTPYDEGINQNFLDGQAERKKTQQPFVVVLRSQLGKFVGCTVNFPPSHINLPPFPALPPPPPPPSVSAPAHVPGMVTPLTVVPDLVIVGKKVGTNDAVAIEATSPPVKPAAPATNQAVVATPVVPPPVKVAPAPVPPPPASIGLVTNLPSVAQPVIPLPTRMVVTQVVVQPAAPVITPAPPMPVVAAQAVTNAVAAPIANNDGGRSRLFIFIGIGLLVVAIGLVLVILRVSRRPPASLITSSMNDEPRRK